MGKIAAAVILLIGMTASLGVAPAFARHAGMPACGEGGHITNTGTLTLKNCVVSGANQSDSEGGGIDNSGTLTLINVIVEDNSASDEGGGIYNEGTLTGRNVTITNNVTTDGDGGGLYNDGGTVNLTNSVISNNSSNSGDGGGIYNTDTMVLKGVTVKGNKTPEGDGAGIYNTRTLVIKGTSGHASISIIQGNSTTGGDGGGLYEDGGTVSIVDTMIQGNSSSDGAGMFNNGGSISMQDAAILKNRASGEGGGLFQNTEASFCCATLDGTDSYSDNLTIAGNTAATDGGGIYNGGGRVELQFATIADNKAPTGAGLSVGDSVGTVELRADLIARNSPANCNLENSLVDDGYNLDTGSTCGFTNWPINNVGNSNVKLTKLEKVGKFLWGEQLMGGSPAIDAVPLSYCTNNSDGGTQLTGDEFDTARPQGSACDVGAAEWVNWKAKG